jgi:uncharacterized protein (TIGR03435 family)
LEIKMFERYTDRSRRVLFFARYEASRLASASIETEHLLLGLIREETGLASQIFAASRLALDQIRKQIEGRSVVREFIVAASTSEIPFSAETRRVLQLASEEADRLLHNHLGTEHLLLGILREERSKAATILMEHGLRIDTVRNDIVRLLYEEARVPPSQDGKPDIPPSFEVHISPTTRREEQGTVGDEGSDYWKRLGFELRPIIAEVYNVDETRIDLPSDLERRSRYDFVLVLPRPASHATIEQLVQRAIEDHFRVAITHETRSMDVYVVTAPDGIKATKLLEDAEGGGMLTSFREFQVDTRIRPLPSMSELFRAAFAGGKCGVFGSGTTIADFCKGLEQNLGRPFVDETGLTGIYDRLELRGDGQSLDEVLQALRDQLGLIATAARRDVTMLVVRPTMPSTT